MKKHWIVLLLLALCVALVVWLCADRGDSIVTIAARGEVLEVLLWQPYVDTNNWTTVEVSPRVAAAMLQRVAAQPYRRISRIPPTISSDDNMSEERIVIRIWATDEYGVYQNHTLELADTGYVLLTLRNNLGLKNMKYSTDIKLYEELRTYLSSSTPVLLGKPIESHGLALELPAAHGVTDPNFASSGQPPFGAGSSKEYTSLTLSFPESANTGVTCWVARLQAFGLDGNAPQQCTYRIARLHDGPKSYLHKEVEYTYTQIEPFILYSSPQVVVLDIATLGNYADEREMLSQHIVQNEGKELGRPALDDSSPRVFADGTTIYKYDWLLPAFDYLTASYRVALAQEKGVMLQFAP